MKGKEKVLAAFTHGRVIGTVSENSDNETVIRIGFPRSAGGTQEFCECDNVMLVAQDVAEFCEENSIPWSIAMMGL